MRCLVAIGIAAIAALSVIATPVRAGNEYPWCAQYRGADSGGGRNCGFSTLEQCRATVSGIGGSCEPNLFYRDRPATLHEARANVSISAAQRCTATPRSERSHAVGAHVAEGHGDGRHVFGASLTRALGVDLYFFEPAISSTRFTMLRRIFASLIRIKAFASASPSAVARKSET